MSQSPKSLSVLLRSLLLIVAAALATAALSAEPLSRGQAIEALAQPDSATRLAGVRRLAEIGTMGDMDVLLERLRDDHGQVRLLAAEAAWRIWGRSGDPEIDELFLRGSGEIGALAGAGQVHVLLGHPEQALDFFRRALAVNPNLEGPAQMKELIEQHLRDEERDRRRHSI